MARTPKAAPAAESSTPATAGVVPLAEIAALKAALPKGKLLSVVTGGRGCPAGHAVCTVVDA